MGLATSAEERDEFMTYRILLALERRLAQRSVKGWAAQMGRVGRDKVNHAMKGIRADIGQKLFIIIIIIIIIIIRSIDTNLPGQSLNSGALGLPALLEQRAALEKQRLNEAMRAESRSTIGSHDWENVLVLCGPAHVKDISAEI